MAAITGDCVKHGGRTVQTTKYRD